MAELKVASLFELEKVLQGRSNKLFYSKSEADAYICKLDNHHKFKRCLDKAELCELRYYRTKDLHRTKDIEDKYYMGSPLFKKRLFKLWLYEKWTNKWLELAEQFKEGV